MRYEDSVAKSAEFLRLAIQKMTKQTAALHPISYAVWYDYVAGVNAALNTEIDQLIKQNSTLDEKTTADMFHKYIVEVDEATALKVANSFQQVMSNVTKSASQAGDEAEKFGNALEHWAESVISSDLGSNAGLNTLFEHTRNIQGSIGALKNQLEESGREIEQLRDEIKKAREDSLADGLTGLINRKGFDMALASCLAKTPQNGEGPSLLMVDIDFFKQVNNTYGHLFGDKVTASVAQILKASLRDTHTVARYGGEEFVILLPDTPLGEAKQLADKIRSTVEKISIRHTTRNENISNITISLGVASYGKGESTQQFISRADSALYDSKKHGRNRVTVASVAEPHRG